MRSPLLKSIVPIDSLEGSLQNLNAKRRGNIVAELFGRFVHTTLPKELSNRVVAGKNMHPKQVSKHPSNLSIIPIFWFVTLSLWCLSGEWISLANKFVLHPGLAEGTSLASAKTANPLALQAQPTDQQDAARAALEAELNSIVQQHDAGTLDGNPKLLSEAIISRLMLDNLTSSAPQLNELIGQGSDVAGLEISSATIGGGGGEPATSGDTDAEQQQQMQSSLAGGVYTTPERWRLKKLLSMLRNYDMLSSDSTGNSANNNQMFHQYPVLPASQAATMKRAAMRMSNLIRQQQQQQRLLNGYNRNNFDFGLGKRPDSTSGTNSILRFGDSSLGADGHVQAVNGMVGQFGKRPSAHRFDFGLGKRVASVSRGAIVDGHCEKCGSLFMFC